jgi:hypothetical protein
VANGFEQITAECVVKLCDLNKAKRLRFPL